MKYLRLWDSEEHKDHSVVQVFQKRTSDFRNFTRARLPSRASRRNSNLDIDTIHVSNPGMDHFAEVEMTERGSYSTERVASVGATKKAKPWITRRKSKKGARPERLSGGAAVPSTAQVERRKRLHSLHTRRTSLENREIFTGVRLNPMMKRGNDNAEVGDAAMAGAADTDGREMGGIEIHYDDDGDAYSYNPVTGETAWLESDEARGQ